MCRCFTGIFMPRISSGCPIARARRARACSISRTRCGVRPPTTWCRCSKTPRRGMFLPETRRRRSRITCSAPGLHKGEDFMTAYAVLLCLALQRNCRIVGTFARLALRDGKRQYLAYLPRVWRHLLKMICAIRCLRVKNLRQWMDKTVPAVSGAGPSIPGLIQAQAAARMTILRAPGRPWCLPLAAGSGCGRSPITCPSP